MTNRIMSREETINAPVGTVLRGPEDTSDRGCVAVRDVDGWSFTSRSGRTQTIPAGGLCTPRYEVLFMPEVPVKVGDVIDGTTADRLPPMSVLRTESNNDADGGIVVITRDLPYALQATHRVYADGSANFHAATGEYATDRRYRVLYIAEEDS